MVPRPNLGGDSTGDREFDSDRAKNVLTHCKLINYQVN